MKKRIFSICLCMLLIVPAFTITAVANEPPSAPTIDGPTSGKPGVEYCWTFNSTDPNDDNVYYYIKWGDGVETGWLGPYPSCTPVSVCYTYEKGYYTILAKARDIHFVESGWSELEVTMVDNQPPSTPTIKGETSGKPGKEYEFTINATDPDGDDVKYYIDWGDNNTEETGFNASGTEVIVKHTWDEEGAYNITAKAEDIHGAEGPEGILTVNIPRNRATVYSLFSWFLERFPLLERLLSLIRLPFFLISTHLHR